MRTRMGVPARNLPLATDASAPVGRLAALGGVMPLARRFVFGLAGEGAQSAFHFALNIALLRWLSEYEYGLFAIVFAMGSLALTYSNALVATPIAVVLPRFGSPGARNFHDSVLGTAALAGSVAAGTICAAGLALSAQGAAIALSGGAFVALWSLRNYVRSALFARREPRIAAFGDGVFAASGLLCSGLALWRAPPEWLLAGALLALAAANAAGIAAALLAAGRPIGLTVTRRMWPRYRRHWSMVSWSLVGVTTSNVQAQAQTFLVAALVGPAAFAPIAAGLMLTAPLRLAAAALISILRPDFAAAGAAGRVGDLRRLLALAASAVAAVSAAYGALLWLAWDWVNRYVFGPSLADEPMSLVMGLAWVLALIHLSYLVPEALLEAMGRFRSVAQATFVSAIVGVAAVTALLLVAAPAWSIVGVIVAEAVTLGWFWLAALRLAPKDLAPTH